MKRWSVIFLLLIIVASAAFSQEEPIPPKRSKGAKVGALAGFTTGMLFMDVKPINAFLSAGKGSALKEGALFLYGGSGAAYVMVLKNVRVGYTGMGGSTKSSSVDASGIRRDAELKAGFGGLTLEYVLPVVPRLDVSLGVLLGWGGLDLTLRKSNGGTTVWDSTSAAFAGAAIGNVPNFSQQLSGHYFIWAPSLNVEYAFLGYLALRVGVSYVGMSFPSWRLDNNYDINGVPDAVTGKGVVVNAGIFLGTF